MLALANGLPITSKPLDNSPDHLTWDVGIGGKAKKKSDRSIFIAPQIAGFNNSLCPPNSKLDYDGKCIQIVNINPAEILVTKLQSILGNGGGSPNTDVDTDYDYYDSAGPFQVNLPLSIDLPVEQPGQQITPEEAFYDGSVIEVSSNIRADSLKQTSTVKSEPHSTFLTESSRDPMDQTAAESHTDISFLAFESLPNGTLSSRVEMDSRNGTFVQKIVLSSTPAAPATTTVDTTDADVVELSSTSTVTSSFSDVTNTASSTAIDELSSSTTDYTTTTTIPTEQYLTSESSIATTTQVSSNDSSDEDIESFKTELAEESFILETSGSTTTDLPSTDMSDFEVDLVTLSTGSTISVDRTTTERSEVTTEETTTASYSIPPFPTRRTFVSPKPVQIVTPVKTKWYSPPGATPPPFIVASYTQQERTTRATPETTTVAVQRTTDAPLLIFNDTEDDKKIRDNIHRQELKDTIRESMDTNNRFVYHHLSASQAPPATPSPSTTTQSHNYVDQLKIINEIVAENKQRHQQAASSNSRIRFPSRDEDQTAAASSHNGVVRFPGSVSNRVTQHANNRIPDIFPKKTPDSTTQRPPFWWLPSGWEVDQTGQKPMLLRFWSRMPLVRDQSLTTTSLNTNNNSNSNRWRPSSSGSTAPSSVSPRGNSRSPSENFYKEVSSQDVYKVLNAHQLNHKR